MKRKILVLLTIVIVVLFVSATTIKTNDCRDVSNISEENVTTREIITIEEDTHYDELFYKYYTETNELFEED